MEYGVIFDLDGTLLNTLDDLADAVNFALGQFSCPLRPKKEIRRFLGNGVRNLMKQAAPDGEQTPRFEELLEAFRAHYAEHCRDKTAPYPGVLPLLQKLKEQGVPMAIVSNKFDQAVKALNRAYFPGLIPVAIGETETVRRKPAPDTVLEALKELGVPASRAVYVGDSEVDLATAANSGLPCISVSWGFRDEEELVRLGAQHLARRPEQILEILKTLTVPAPAPDRP